MHFEIIEDFQSDVPHPSNFVCHLPLKGEGINKNTKQHIKGENYGKTNIRLQVQHRCD